MDHSRKEPFEIVPLMQKLRRAVRDYPKAAMFELADDGFTSLFEQLVSCIISIRTFEEVTLATARRLFAAARTPVQIAELSVAQIDELIGTCTFHGPKARQIHTIARRAVDEFAGQLPSDRAVVLSFAGVGPKCANLAMGVARGKPVGVPVDVHVHRVVNRWGIVKTRTTEETAIQLETVLARRYWLEINKLLVPFGRNNCKSVKPKCPDCPLLSMCRQVGVTSVSRASAA